MRNGDTDIVRALSAGIAQSRHMRREIARILNLIRVEGTPIIEAAWPSWKTGTHVIPVMLDERGRVVSEWQYSREFDDLSRLRFFCNDIADFAGVKRLEMCSPRQAVAITDLKTVYDALLVLVAKLSEIPALASLLQPREAIADSGLIKLGDINRVTEFIQNELTKLLLKIRPSWEDGTRKIYCVDANSEIVGWWELFGKSCTWRYREYDNHVEKSRYEFAQGALTTFDRNDKDLIDRIYDAIRFLIEEIRGVPSAGRILRALEVIAEEHNTRE